MIRENKENIVDLFWKYGLERNWSGLGSLFDEDARFVNPLLEKAITGRDDIQNLFSEMETFVNVREWTVAEGNRVVVGWRERLKKDPEDRPWYKGVTSFLINENGLIKEYEAFFDVKSFIDSYKFQ